MKKDSAIARIRCADDSTGTIHFDSSAPHKMCLVAWDKGNTLTYHPLREWEQVDDVWAYAVQDNQNIALYPLPFGYGGAFGIARSFEEVHTPEDYAAWCDAHVPIAASGVVPGDTARIEELVDALSLLCAVYDEPTREMSIH